MRVHKTVSNASTRRTSRQPRNVLSNVGKGREKKEVVRAQGSEDLQPRGDFEKPRRQDTPSPRISVKSTVHQSMIQSARQGKRRKRHTTQLTQSILQHPIQGGRHRHRSGSHTNGESVLSLTLHIPTAWTVYSIRLQQRSFPYQTMPMSSNGCSSPSQTQGSSIPKVAVLRQLLEGISPLVSALWSSPTHRPKMRKRKTKSIHDHENTTQPSASSTTDAVLYHNTPAAFCPYTSRSNQAYSQSA